MQISEKQLDKFIEISKQYYPDKNISREEALDCAIRLLNVMKIILENDNRKNKDS